MGKSERLNKDLENINRYQPEMINEVPHSYKNYMQFVDESIQSKLNFLMDRKMERYLKLLKYSKNQIILEFNDLSISFEKLMEAIPNYFSILLNYYFPDSGEKKRI